MSGIAIVELLGGVRGTVFAGIAAVAIVTAGVQTWRVSAKSSEIDTLKLENSAWADAQEKNLDTIAELRAANKAWADSARAGQEAAKAAIELANTERDRLAREIQTTRRERSKLYESNPEAAAWGRGRVPTAVADSLRAGQNNPN